MWKKNINMLLWTIKLQDMLIYAKWCDLQSKKYDIENILMTFYKIYIIFDCFCCCQCLHKKITIICIRQDYTIWKVDNLHDKPCNIGHGQTTTRRVPNDETVANWVSVYCRWQKPLWHQQWRLQSSVSTQQQNLHLHLSYRLQEGGSLQLCQEWVP